MSGDSTNIIMLNAATKEPHGPPGHAAAGQEEVIGPGSRWTLGPCGPFLDESFSGYTNLGIRLVQCHFRIAL